ncbi:hypothetical protein GDO81_014958 [Engystomops pustulosus]|uniref:WAP domain-containing protein n=1 Tax=Engystomops pustulosus TaxID=76066 RepID=A0AAV7ALQ0_ENGPU|nr:hypothetical protein GDO81_014958 [Engystomops pustulosus]
MRSLVVYLLLFFVFTSFTSGFLMRRSGCPSPNVNYRCPPASQNQCSFDIDCRGSLRCCNNGCNSRCVDNLAASSSFFSLFYNPFSYAAYGPFRD